MLPFVDMRPSEWVLPRQNSGCEIPGDSGTFAPEFCGRAWDLQAMPPLVNRL